MLTNSITYNGITWNFTHSVSAGQYINGDWWVLASPSNGVEISSITPQVVLGEPLYITGLNSNWDTVHQDRNGSVLNPHFTRDRYQGTAEIGGAPGPDGKSPSHGFHGSSIGFLPNGFSWKNYKRSTNWAVTTDSQGSAIPINSTYRKILPVGNSLVSCDSTLPGGISPNGGRTNIRRHATLTCVSAYPGSAAFRPAYSYSDKSVLCTSADIDYTVLGNINASDVSSLAPSTTYFDVLVSGLKYPFMGYQSQSVTYGYIGSDDCLAEPYGRDVAVIQNTALAYINTNLISSANKVTLANYLIQRGLDILGSIEESFATSSTIGLPAWKWSGGGQQHSYEVPIVFLLGMLKPGALKERVREVLEICKTWYDTHYAVFVSDSILFEVSSQHLTATQNKLKNFYPQYSAVSSHLTFQTSDIGMAEWRRVNDGNSTNAMEEYKAWSQDEAIYYMSSQPSYFSGHADAFWNAYRICCSHLVFYPVSFAWKAMGIEKLMNNKYYNRCLARYDQRQTFGPFPEAGYGGYTHWSTATNVVNGAGTGFTALQSISTQFATKLYQKWVHNSMQGPSGAGTIAASLPVSGIESLSLPTDPSIYIECSGPFIAGQTNYVYCKGVQNYNAGDYMNLFVAVNDQWAERYIDILGAKLQIGGSITVFPFVKAQNSSYATLSLFIPLHLKGEEYVFQAILVNVVNNELNINSTNALKVKIV